MDNSIDLIKEIEKSEKTTPVDSKNSNFLVTLLSTFLIITSIIAGFFAYQTQNLVKEITKLKVVSTPTPIAIGTEKPVVAPSITNPSDGSLVSSPLNITGFVPDGWMFEGSFPIKILDENRKLIKQVIAKEKIEGSWTTAGPIEFVADVSFLTTAINGYIVLENDNPSGLKENSKTFEIMVSFSKDSTVCTMDAKVCPDGSSVGRSGPKCEFDPCPATSL